MHVLSWCVEHKNSDFTKLLKKEYDLICPSKTDKIPYEYFINKTYELLDSHSIKVLIMNGKTDVDSAQYENGCNFVIGGYTLGRGVTFPGIADNLLHQNQ